MLVSGKPESSSPGEKNSTCSAPASESDSRPADHAESLAIDCPLCSSATMIEERLGESAFRPTRCRCTRRRNTPSSRRLLLCPRKLSVRFLLLITAGPPIAFFCKGGVRSSRWPESFDILLRRLGLAESRADLTEIQMRINFPEASHSNLVPRRRIRNVRFARRGWRGSSSHWLHPRCSRNNHNLSGGQTPQTTSSGRPSWQWQDATRLRGRPGRTYDR